MRFDDLDLNLLAVLDMLLETRSVSETARRLHRSQPAITGALNRLRAFFGDDLLVSSGRQMLPTRRAAELTKPVRRALMLIRGEITQPGSFDPSTSRRHFIIAASDYAYTILLSHIIVEAARIAPGISFEVIPPSGEASDRLSRAEIDLLFTVAPFQDASHPFLPLWRDEEVIISWAGAGYPDEIDSVAFYRASHALVVIGSDRRPTVTDAYVQKSHPERVARVQVPGFSSLPLAITGTARLATMHRLYAEHFARAYPIKIHRPAEAFPEIVEGVQWHQIHSRDPGTLWLLDRLKCQRDQLPEHSQMT